MPILLILLFIPLGFFIHSSTKEDRALKNVMNQQIKEKLFVTNQTFSSQTKRHLFLLIVTLFIIALARPIKPLVTLEVIQKIPSVIVTIDMSYSMNKTDIFPSRKAFAKAKALNFIEKAIGYEIGLLFYANDAYMLYPLTQERKLLLTLLKDANITQKFMPNSNLFSALEASVLLLKSHQNRHIILLSDGGEEVSRAKELVYMKSKNITLSTLAINPKTNHEMKKLCSKTSGIYEPFSWSDEDITKIIEHINAQDTSSKELQLKLPQYEEYFHYPLTVALLLLILFFLPLKRTTIMLGLLYVQPSSLHAGVFDFWHIYQAQKAMQKHNYSKVIEEYQQVELNPKIEYNLGYVLYKNKQYNQAIKHYQKALGITQKMNAKVYYNIGTTYARQNKLKFAKESYEKSFALNPTKITQENLNSVTLALKKQRKNLHKKYEKLKFKAIGENAYTQNNAFSNYAIKLHNFMPSEEERWFQKVENHQSLTYLQKITTTKRSLDANISW